MGKTKKLLCVVGVVVAAVFGTYTREDTPLRSAAGNPLRFSQAALLVIGDAEGCRRDPYMCPAARLTAGLGHTGSGLDRNTPEYSLQQIERWFAEDTFAAQDCLEKYVEARTGKQLPQGVFDAFGSFVFNMGCGKFRTYPVFNLLLHGDYAAACARLPLYVYGGGVPLPGLKVRRGKEKALCGY